MIGNGRSDDTLPMIYIIKLHKRALPACGGMQALEDGSKRHS
jgi:hypothetical protein